MLTSGAFGYIGDYILWCALFASLIANTWCFFKLIAKRERQRWHFVAGNALVFASLLGAAAMIGETYFRFVCIETDAFGMSLPARRWFALHTTLNSGGYRDTEWAVEKPPGVRRIAFVGDSFTYGWGVERPEDRFPDRIAARWRASKSGAVEVMNVAKPGWDTRAEFTALVEIVDRFGVDEVVLCYVPNDIEKLLPRTLEFDPIRPPQPVLVNPTSSVLVDYLYHRLWVPRVGTVSGYHDWLAEGFADTKTWRRHQQELFAMVELCRDRGVAFRVALLPFIRTAGQKYKAVGIHRILRDFFAANDVPVVDLLPAIANHPATELTVNRQDTHPNEEAHELFADAMWRAWYADEN